MSEMSNIAGAGGLVRASLASTGRWAGTLGLIGGIVADILNPLAPFAAYIALLAAVAALILGVAIAFRLLLATKALPALVFASTTAAIAGGIFALQQSEDAQDGVIAGLVPAIAELQKSMGLVAAKVENIERTVTETKDTVEEVKQSTDKIAANQAEQKTQVDKLQQTSEQIAVSIDAIAKGFATLAAQGGTIADPKRPDEFYHNARVQELGGDMLNARRSYLGFANFDVDAIDPYQRFATLLRVQDGRAGAREVFGQLAEKGKAPAVKLVHALQFEDGQRLEKLNAFIAANPDYAPAYYALAQEYSEDRLGAQSLSEKRAEAEALTKFMSYEKDGGLLKYFVDHAELSSWLEGSKRRLAALGNVLDPASYAPTIVSSRSNQGWTISILLPEATTSISWRMGKEGPFVETGLTTFKDQRTGKPMPNSTFEVPSDAKADIISIKYVDQRGNDVGPFEVPFDPQAALAQSNKQLLDQYWTSWIVFDASGNRGLAYYTNMLSYRCAIKQVNYGLNGAALDKQLKIPACDEKDPYAIPDGFIPYFKVGEEVTSMQVQIVYSDGSQSVVREFRRSQ